MFGLAWTEIGLIGVVAMVLIGPKDLPIAIRAISDLIKKARRMAGEFQGHVDEMVREADSTGGLSEMRRSISQLRSFDIKGQVIKAVDGDGSLRAAVQAPLVEDWGAPSNPTIHPGADAPAMPPAVPEGHVELSPAAEHTPLQAPAFIPPSAAPLGLRWPEPASEQSAPSFIPPAVLLPAVLPPVVS